MKVLAIAIYIGKVVAVRVIVFVFTVLKCQAERPGASSVPEKAATFAVGERFTLLLPKPQNASGFGVELSMFYAF